MIDKLVEKVSNIDKIGFVLRVKYDTDKTELENKISDTIRLTEKVDYDAKITEIKNKIPSISGLATNAALIAMEKSTKINELRENVLIMMLTNILLLQKLISFQQIFLMQD